MKKSLITLALISAVAFPAFASDYQAGDIVIRGGFTQVNPDNDQATVFLDASALPLGLSVEDNTQLGLNFVYFYDQNWAVELLAATPFSHDVILHDNGGATNAIYGINLNDTELAQVKHLPPTLSALYYFTNASAFKSYVGLGVNYTIFFDEEFTATPKAAGFSDLSLDASWGYSVQVGGDYQLNNDWHVNLSARYIDINTDATFNLENDLNVTGGLAGKGSASVNVDPMVYSFMLGYKF